MHFAQGFNACVGYYLGNVGYYFNQNVGSLCNKKNSCQRFNLMIYKNSLPQDICSFSILDVRSARFAMDFCLICKYIYLKYAVFHSFNR